MNKVLSVEINGREYELRTTRDLANYQRMVAHPELSCVQDEEGLQKLRSLLADHAEAGSPQLEVIDEGRERIRMMIEMDVFLGGVGRSFGY